MATVITTVMQNFLNEKATFDSVNAEDVVGTWRVNMTVVTRDNMFDEDIQRILFQFDNWKG